MRKFILVVLLVIVSPTLSLSHPGRTASDGCHYCRTNCDKWGVPWGERHCHEKKEITPPKIQIKNEEKTKSQENKKYPGWEYGLKIEKIKTEEMPKLKNND